MPTHEEVTQTILEMYGPVAARECEHSRPVHDTDLLAFALKVREMSDDELTQVACDAILASAQMDRLPGQEHYHCKGTMTYSESKRRLEAAGHTEECSPSSLYSIAHERAVRSAGHQPMSPLRPCSCRVAGELPAP